MLIGANIQEKRTTTVHKTITHSNSGQNILQNQGQPQPQPAQVQWQAPSNAGSNLQESRSVHSTTTHSTTGGQSNIADPGQQPQSVSDMNSNGVAKGGSYGSKVTTWFSW